MAKQMLLKLSKRFQKKTLNVMLKMMHIKLKYIFYYCASFLSLIKNAKT